MNLIQIIRAHGMGTPEPVVPGESLVLEPGDSVACDIPFTEVSSIVKIDDTLLITVGTTTPTSFAQFFTNPTNTVQFQDQTLNVEGLEALLKITLSLTDVNGIQHSIALAPGSSLDTHPGDIYNLGSEKFNVDDLHRHGVDLSIQTHDEATLIGATLRGFFIKSDENINAPQLEMTDSVLGTTKDVIVHPHDNDFMWEGEPLPQAVVGSMYGYYFHLEGEDAENFSLVAKTIEGTLPAWLNFSSLGNGSYFLYGMPTAAAVGSHEIFLLAHGSRNGVGLHTQQSYFLSIKPVGNGSTRAAADEVAAAEFRKAGQEFNADTYSASSSSTHQAGYITMPEIAAMSSLPLVNPIVYNQTFSNNFAPYQLEKAIAATPLLTVTGSSKPIDLESGDRGQLTGAGVVKLPNISRTDVSRTDVADTQESTTQPVESTEPQSISSPEPKATTTETNSEVKIIQAPPEPPTNVQTVQHQLIVPPPPPPPPVLPTSLNMTDLDGSNGFSMQSVTSNDLFGYESNIIPDINGDGFAELIISVLSGGSNYDGQVFLVFGSSYFPASFDITSLSVNSAIFDSPISSTLNPGTVFGVGDFNGDGLNDLLINTAFGRHAYIIFGDLNGYPPLSNLSVLTASGGGVDISNTFGGLLTDGTSLGDINGDGLADVAVSSAVSGAAYVLFGSTSPPTSIDVSTLNGTNGFMIRDPGARSANQGITSTDINGDGYNDLIYKTRSASGQEKVNVVFGHAGPFPAVVDVPMAVGDGFTIIDSSISNYRALGKFMSNIGDINDDGVNDLMVVQQFTGTAYVIFGSPSFDSTTTFDVSTMDGTNGFKIKHSSYMYISGAAYIGDVNGDGIADIALPEWTSYDGAGAVHIIFGSKNPFAGVIDIVQTDPTVGFTIIGDPANILGTIGGGADLNGDGLDDLVINNYPFAGDTQGLHVIFGANFSGLITHMGGSGNDNLSATAGDDVIYSAQGDDIIDGLDGNDFISGGSGADSINGGAGDDRIVFDRNDFTVDGGTGMDTLWFRDDGVIADLRGTTTFTGMDIIDLRGVKALIGNGITLDAATVLSMSDSNVLTINGGAHDSVKLDATDYWITSADNPGYTTYTALNGSVISIANAINVVYTTPLTPIMQHFTLNSLMDGARGVDITPVLTASNGYAATSSTIIQDGDGFDNLLIANGFVAGGSPFTRAFMIDGQATFPASLPFNDPALTLTTFNNDSFAFPIAAYGQHVAAISDFNGDGIGDILISEFYGDPSHIFLGQPAGLVSPVTFSTDGIRIFSSLGDASVSASALGDVQGDRLADIIFSNSTNGWGAVIFGTTLPGTSIDQSTLTGTNGFQLARPGSSLAPGVHDVAGADISGDGKNDIMVSYYDTSTQMGGIGVILGSTPIFSATVSVSSAGISGANGFIITNSAGVPGSNNFLINPTGIGDFSGDGIGDIALSSKDTVYVLFGNTDYELATPIDVAALGSNGFKLTSGVTADITNIAYVGDVNGDGISDFAFFDRGAYSGLGAVYTVFGVPSGGPMADINYTQMTFDQGFVITDPTGFTANNTVGGLLGDPSVGGGGDLNGDGFDDIVITSGSHQYLVFGGNFSGAVSQIGDVNHSVIQARAGDQIIYGTSGNDTLIATTGNNLLDGGAGADIINGGNGNDTIVFDFNDIAVNGGTGTQDTLWFKDDNTLADLQGTSIFSNIDVVDLQALHSLTGNRIELGYSDVNSISGGNSLIINGGAHDSVVLHNDGDVGWSMIGTTVISGANYHIYEASLVGTIVYGEDSLQQVSIV